MSSLQNSCFLYISLCTILGDEGKGLKKRDLEKQLKKWGWYFKRHGGSHDYWTNGEMHEAIPRHSEINEMLAKKILKKAKANLKKK